MSSEPSRPPNAFVSEPEPRLPSTFSFSVLTGFSIGLLLCPLVGAALWLAGQRLGQERPSSKAERSRPYLRSLRSAVPTIVPEVQGSTAFGR
jgi:hypothetical protein